MIIACPACGGRRWHAIESGKWLTPADLLLEDGEVVIETNPLSVLVQESLESVVLAYTCASESCTYTIEADRVNELRRV